MNQNKQAHYILLLIFLLGVSTFVSAQESDTTMIIKEVYFATKSGERIEEINGRIRKIYFVVVSKNLIGKEVTMQLDSEDLGVIHKRRYYTAQDNFTFVIKGDVHKMKLIPCNYRKKRHHRIKARAIKKRQ